jgi:hypothetical protein
MLYAANSSRAVSFLKSEGPFGATDPGIEDLTEEDRMPDGGGWTP